MVRRSLSDITFSDAKQLLIGCRGQIGRKDAKINSKVFLQNCKMKLNGIVVLKSKKMFFFEKIDKNFQLNSLLVVKS